MIIRESLDDSLRYFTSSETDPAELYDKLVERNEQLVLNDRYALTKELLPSSGKKDQLL